MTSKTKVKKAGTIWITGLAASGKTTLAKRLAQDLERLGIKKVIVLDGEEVREKLEEFGYLTEDRNAIGIKKAMLALKYNQNGTNVIITGIAHHRETREKIRNMFNHYAEVFLDCTVEACAKRDYKGHYEKAFKGEYKNFIGVTEPYQKSSQTELVLNTASLPIDQCAKRLLEFTLEFIGEDKQTKQNHDEENEKTETITQ